MKYRVPISYDFEVEADSAADARKIVVDSIEGLLPDDSYLLGETIWADDIVDTPEEIKD